jgi:hypothetical protein
VIEPFPTQHPPSLTSELLVKILLQRLSSHLPHPFLARAQSRSSNQV